MTSWGYPDLEEEEALHKSRLLNVEEKPFRRLTKRLLTEPSPLYSLTPNERPPNAPSEPVGGDTTPEEAVVDTRTVEEKATDERRQFREDVILDFAAFESSLVRIQFLRRSNTKERERYAAEKIKIEETAQNVRDSTAGLRIQLDEAQKTLAIRKTYDELVEKITSNKSLKARDEQQVNLEKLRSEIEDLERESREHDQAWRERREQFGRVAEEGTRLRRLVRDEKEEVAVPESDDLLEVDHARGGRSTVGTPRPDEGGLTPMHHGQGENGALTPRSRRGTPQPDEVGSGVTGEKPMETIPEIQEKEDADMADEGEVGESLKQVEDETAEDKPALRLHVVKRKYRSDQMDTS